MQKQQTRECGQTRLSTARKIAIIAAAGFIGFAAMSKKAHAEEGPQPQIRATVNVGAGATNGRLIGTAGVSFSAPLTDQLRFSTSIRLATDGRNTAVDNADINIGTQRALFSAYTSPDEISNYGGVLIGTGIKFRIWRLTLFPHVFWGENERPRAVLPINYGQSFMNGRINFWGGPVIHLNSAAYEQGPFLGAQGELSVRLFGNLRAYVYGFLMMARQVVNDVRDYAVGCWSVRTGLAVPFELPAGRNQHDR
ncbi:hypothetical protein KKF81_00200 [Candidatus Micrarchaeota archaeon]|nr:hypothetical protein [Candidatus Micrarchaeota archaeon]MBU1165338.1 hypothetical protein [Candidatus Micrarchaeota archaeon]MBU1886988.1 hypothetical protein [Candidatus Micrarchaeota archaeon]